MKTLLIFLIRVEISVHVTMRLRESSIQPITKMTTNECGSNSVVSHLGVFCANSKKRRNCAGVKLKIPQKKKCGKDERSEEAPSQEAQRSGKPLFRGQRPSRHESRMLRFVSTSPDPAIMRVRLGRCSNQFSARCTSNTHVFPSFRPLFQGY